MANEIIEPDEIDREGNIIEFHEDLDIEVELEDHRGIIGATYPVDDPVNHPSHYTQGTMECIDAIEGLGLPFHESQILKYITRWRFKNGVQDLKKARWYLDRLISQNETKSND